MTADVTFVYPVTRADAGGDDEVVRTIVRRALVMSWDDPAKVVTEPGTISIVSYKLDMTNGGCSAPTGYFAPPFGRDRRADADGTGSTHTTAARRAAARASPANWQLGKAGDAS